MASLFNLAAVKNTLDEVRAQVYPRNETERKVKLLDELWYTHSSLIFLLGLRSPLLKELGGVYNFAE